jgi:hypothetical protein
MDAIRLEDRLRWGLNLAARYVGVPTDAYRPRGISDPLVLVNRFLRLHATFTSVRGEFARTNFYGNSLWYGIFDAAYTQPGDYLVQDEGTWFVASQHRLLPVLCVRADRVISFNRPVSPSGTGASTYGGITAVNMTPLMVNWPASVVAASSGGRPFANLPADNAAVPYWTVLLPSPPGVVLRPTDLMSDDLGRNAVVMAAELSELGWRLTVKQVTT